MNNDLISRSVLLEAIRKRLGISSLNFLTEQEKVIVEEIFNAPTVPLPDFKEGYKQAILDGKLNYGGQVVPNALHGWIYEDRQITIEEYMQSLKGEKNERRR